MPKRPSSFLISKNLFLKFIFVFFVMTFLALPSSTQAASIEAMPKNLVEIRCGGFIHANKTIRHLYGNIGTSYSLEVSHQFKPSMACWVNLDYFSKQGKISGCSSGHSGHTHMKLPNLSIGLKYFYPIQETITLYIGLGPSLSGVFIRNRSECLREKVSRAALGIITKTGIYYPFYENFFADFFIDYLYQPVRFKKQLDIGGMKTGIGIGYGF